MFFLHVGHDVVISSRTEEKKLRREGRKKV
jgi:hypothetical protein